MDRAATRVDGLAVAAAVFLSGAVLLGVGAREEFSPVASFAAPLAKLR